MSRISMFDVINSKKNLVKEYRSLVNLFYEEEIYRYGGKFYSLYELFDKIFSTWRYRGTYVSLDSLIADLEINGTTNPNKCLTDILMLIELIKNIELFFNDNDIKPYKKSMLFGNVDILLNELNYKAMEADDKIILVSNNSDALVTAVIVDDNNIQSKILSYLDFRIENDVLSKKDILKSLGDYLEPKRDDIKTLNSKLEDSIFYMLNKLNIRHNNMEGKNKVEFIKNFSDNDFIRWYDELYGQILLAIRLLDFSDSYTIIKELKENIG